MAGSYLTKQSDVQPLLHAHIEGLKLLAHHLDEPIVIFDHEMRLVYANSSAHRLVDECPLIPEKTTLLSESYSPKHPPCDPCPATQFFQIKGQAQDVSTVSSSIAEILSRCPLPRVVPLKSEDGTAHCALLMRARDPESVVVSGKGEELPLLDNQQDQILGEGSEGPIIGESEPIRQLVEMVKLVAASEATVLIQGESGTGKELVAKTIHALSRRRAGPFTVVECSSLPETLLESELFGHVRGAFTGAVADRKGLFEEAEGGTIFLDEIADTTSAFQARLLRVLQEGEIKPVGSSQAIKVNVRVISAGNKPLHELVTAKQFRADLYYRLAVLPLDVPCLRERPKDIPLLAKHFLNVSARRHARPALTLHTEALRALHHHNWPGNVRELENLIERAVVTCRKSMIQVSDLFAENKTVSSTNGHLRVVSQTARRTAERNRILQALSETKGDKTRAARLLKISRSTLYNKLHTYKVL